MISQNLLQELRKPIYVLYARMRIFLRYLHYKSLLGIKIYSQKKEFKNQEDLTNFNFYLPVSIETKGISALLRVKNEEQKIFCCLQSIIQAFDEIILMNNQSQDATLDIASEFKQQYDVNNKIKLLNYPFRITRFGDESKNISEHSVYSPAYYTNYVLSHCSFKYACRWDADMVLNKDNLDKFRSFVEEINRKERNIYGLAGQTVYRSLNGSYWLSNEEIYCEARIIPVSYFNHFVSDNISHKLRSPLFLTRKDFSGVTFFELKFTNEDEFSHWTNNKFSIRARKHLEWENFHLIKSGKFPPDNKFTPLPSDFLKT